jgi:60 kDa SS-A/Ro ribonucleoprotein
MARTNIAPRTVSNRVRTHNAAPAARLSNEQVLERTVGACMLWEDSFYESGRSIATRIVELADECSANFVADLAYRVRHEMHLRHAPLLLLRALVRKGNAKLTENALASTIARPDELSEFLSLYWATNDGKKTIPHAVRRGLGKAFAKFDAYQLAKWRGDNSAIKLRDVLNLVHPVTADKAKFQVWTDLRQKALKNTKTWEAKQSKAGRVASAVAADHELSASERAALTKDAKRLAWEAQLDKGEIGYDALLKNLRNMVEAGVKVRLVEEAIVARKGAHRTLPFRYLVAARYAPEFKKALDQALVAAIEDLPRISGKTAILVDLSGSMDDKLADKSELIRKDAAAALAALFPGEADVYTFTDSIRRVQGTLKGITGIEKILGNMPSGGTRIGEAVAHVNNGTYDRIVVLTDEQSSDVVAPPKSRYSYVISLASYEPALAEMVTEERKAPRKRGRYGDLLPHAVEYGEWVRITGFSENTFRYIADFERSKY